MYRYTILIVDDDRLLQNSLRNILSEKYDPLIAGSGEEALRLLKKNPVDLVLLDIRLPGIDGIETLQQIKSLEPRPPDHHDDGIRRYQDGHYLDEKGRL